MSTLTLDLADPVTQGLAAVAALVLLWLLRRALRPSPGRQDQLIGGLAQVAQAQAEAQLRLGASLESRLDQVRAQLGDSLGDSASRTARALGALHERLAAIDRAQANIERLSGDVLGLQDILSNKQTRGAFGEIQLAEILGNALPPDAYTLQATLQSGRRADCLIHLPQPPGPLAIDAKFPLEAYEALRAARDERARDQAARALRQAVQTHLRAIAERYIVPGETADQALMFLPSEAVYAELHANFADVVRQGFALRVWIVSPTTLMAVLTTLRAVLRDVALGREGARIQAELAQLTDDLRRLGDRAQALGKHFAAAAEDLAQLQVSVQKAGVRAARLGSLDWTG